MAVGVMPCWRASSAYAATDCTTLGLGPYLQHERMNDTNHVSPAAVAPVLLT